MKGVFLTVLRIRPSPNTQGNTHKMTLIAVNKLCTFPELGVLLAAKNKNNCHYAFHQTVSMKVIANSLVSTHPAELVSNWLFLSVESTSLIPISRFWSSRIFQQVWCGFFDSHFGSEMTKVRDESEACLWKFFQRAMRRVVSVSKLRFSTLIYTFGKGAFLTSKRSKGRFESRKSLQTFLRSRLSKILRNR